MDAKDIFKEENIADSNWFKFEKVGDAIHGTLVSVKDKEGQDGFGPQKVYELLLSNGEYWNVGISVKKSYIIDRMRRAQIGQVVGFKFLKEVPSKKKGYAPAKSIEVYMPKDGNGKYIMDENFLEELNETQEVVGEPAVDADTVMPFES